MDQAGTSAAERRRAARQRKILENAESRMNRLYGRPDGDQPRTPQRGQTDGESARPAGPGSGPSSGHCPDPPDQSIDEVLGRSLPLLRGRPAAGMASSNMEDLFRQLNGGPAGAGGLGGGSAAYSDDSGGGGVHPSPAWRRWDRHRWLVVALLAAVTRLAALAGVGAAVTQNVLVPFFVLEVTVYITRLWFVPLRTNMGLLGTALALCGVPPRTLDLWGRYITFLSHAWNDFMVYMFVIVFSFRFGGDIAATASSSGKGREDGASPSPPSTPTVDDHLDYEF